MANAPPITFGSVCSGIEAASVALGPLGFVPAWLSEIDPFASAVLAHHYPPTAGHTTATRSPRKMMKTFSSANATTTMRASG